MGVLRRDREGHRDTEKAWKKGATETGVLVPQARIRSPQERGPCKEGFPLQPWKELGHADALISALWPQNHGRLNFGCFKSPSLW